MDKWEEWEEYLTIDKYNDLELFKNIIIIDE